MSAGINTVSFDIVPHNGGRYKSIATLSWADVPGFAILTGRNGSGKTQLLELLAYHFTGATPPWLSHGARLPVEVHVSGQQYKPEEIAYVPSAGRFSGGPPVSLANITEHNPRQILHQVRNNNQPHDIAQVIRARRVISRLGGLQPEQLDENTLARILSESEALADDIDITAGLTRLFLAHRLKIMEALERDTPGVDEAGNSLGPAPWETVNEALSVAGFPYQVISPSKTRLRDHYTLKLKDRQSEMEVAAIDLSSGEKVILQLVLWLYAASDEGRFPKFLLLDEPDAHLHPSMTTQFLDVISEVLVNRHGIRVIMTTHSPSTVALAPEGSIFQLERGSSSVTKVDHRPSVISILTSGLVTVSRSTKFCFVEDQSDIDFYAAVYEVLTDHGPNPDPMALHPSPSIAFIPASVGTGAGRISGGHTVVRKWVEKLDKHPLDTFFFGIIDRDTANVASGRIHVLGRYSFENYLLDPLNIFCILIEEGTAPSIPGLKISIGSEHLLRLQPDDVLQAIVDDISARMLTAEPNLALSALTQVKYTVGRQIAVPAWVINYRGHDLLQIAQTAFGGPRVVSPPRLLRALKRGRLLPVELATLLATIQRA